MLCANALHLTLRIRLLDITAAFDFRKCKRLLLSSLAVSALYRGPRGILCTRGEKEYASIRQPTAACDNRLVKREAYDVWPWLLCIVRTIYFFITLQSFLLNKHAAQRHVTNCFFDQTIAVNVICLSFACLFLFPTSTIVSCGGPYANSRRTPTQSVGVLATGRRRHKKRQPMRLSFFMVPVAGLEPARYRYRWILSYLLHTEYKRTQTPMEVVNGHLKARNY